MMTITTTITARTIIPRIIITMMHQKHEGQLGGVVGISLLGVSVGITLLDVSVGISHLTAINIK